MALTYNNKVWAPDHVEEIFSEVLFASRSISRGLVRGETDIVHSRAITSLTGNIELGPRIDHVTDEVWASRSNNLAFSDGTLVPAQLMALEKFNMNDLRNSRFSRTMKANDRTFKSTDFEKAVLDYTLPRIGQSYDRRMHVGITADTQAAVADSNLSASIKAWAAAQKPGLVNGFTSALLKRAIAGQGVIIVAATTLTAANIATEYGKMYAAAPTAVASSPETVIFAPVTDRALILQYNLAQTVRDTFLVSGLNTENESFSYLGMPIEFVEVQGMDGDNPTGAPVRYMGKAKGAGHFVYGTNTLSALNEAKVDLINTFSTLIGMRLDCMLDTDVLVPQQKVLYL